MTETSILQRMASGALWMIFMRFSVKSISIVSTLILARLLTPEDFGVMALVSSIYALVELLRAFGFDVALIQNQKADRDHYDTAWTLNILFALLATTVILLSAPLAGRFFQDNRLIPALYMIALMVFIDGFSNIGTVEFRKQLDFKREYPFHLLTKLSGFLVTIPLAFYWRSYWAMLYGMLTTTIMWVVLSYALQGYRPRFSLKARKDLLTFSFWLLINNALQYLNKNSHTFILGKLIGSARLGIYSLAEEIAMLAANELIAPINSAAYPGYAKLAENPADLKQAYLATQSYIVLLSLPCALGIAVTAPVLVPVMLGSQWLAAVPVMQIIALAAALESINTNTTYVFLTLARQSIITRLLILRALLLVPLLVWLAGEWGLTGAAGAVLITTIIITPVNFQRAHALLKVKIREYLAIAYRPLLSALIMAWLVFGYLDQQQLDRSSTELIPIFLIAVGLGAVVYTGMIWLLWLITGRALGAENTLFNAISRQWARVAK